MKIEEAANKIVDELYVEQYFNDSAHIIYREQDFDKIFEEVEVEHVQLYWFGFTGYFRLKLLPLRTKSNWEVQLHLPLDFETCSLF